MNKFDNSINTLDSQYLAFFAIVKMNIKIIITAKLKKIY